MAISSPNMDRITFYNIKEEPFCVYGLLYENGMYRRLPEAVAKSVSEGVYSLHAHTAGGRVRFTTNSPFVAIRVSMPIIEKMPHFALTGSAGFDLYVGENEEYCGSFIPPFDVSNGYESVIHFETAALREITINFPLYSGVSELNIGLHPEAVVKKSPGYESQKPIVFYGSSITQGGCASRPGNAYTAMVARALQYDHLNLGFSGNAKAEDEIADYIKNLHMSVFVYDYDHNAPDLSHLEATHQRMFTAIREAHPELPIVILSRPKFILTDEEMQRLEIIRKTWRDAVSAGDRHTYLIEGPELMQYAQNHGTVDDCHPNDLGFYSMAEVLTGVLHSIIENNP